MIGPEITTVPADSESETIDDFIKAARNGEISVVTSGAGTSHHMNGIALQNRADLNLDIINVPAFGEQLQQIAAGHVQAAIWPWGEASAGVIRPLAVVASGQIEPLPDVVRGGAGH